VLGRNVDDAEEWVRSWSAQVSGRAGATAALADRVAQLSASAVGADRAIRVTVGSSGAVTGLELDDRVQRMTGAELAAEILAVMRRAQAGLADRVAEAVDETVGSDTETGRAVLDSFSQRFPAEPDESPTTPVMPSPPPFPTFETPADDARPHLPQQASRNTHGGGRGDDAR
jgi:hypothetical protein